MQFAFYWGGAVNKAPAPVQLTYFNCICKEPGSAIIKWSIPPNLDTAGFNILRSDSKDGEFIKVNEKLISTEIKKDKYRFIDKDDSIKPGIKYFYQIEDVSLDGEYRTLKTTRLRGHISDKGIITTLWAKLKKRR